MTLGPGHISGDGSSPEEQQSVREAFDAVLLVAGVNYFANGDTAVADIEVPSHSRLRSGEVRVDVAAFSDALINFFPLATELLLAEPGQLPPRVSSHPGRVDASLYIELTLHGDTPDSCGGRIWNIDDTRLRDLMSKGASNSDIADRLVATCSRALDPATLTPGLEAALGR